MNNNETSQSLTPEEIEQARPYWNQITNDSLFLIFGTIAVEIVMLLMLSSSSKSSPIWGLFVLPIGSIWGLVDFLRVYFDKKQKDLYCEKGVFEENGLPVSRFTTFVAQRINDKRFIFPPKIYYQLTKGDNIEVHYTPILRIVVGCREIQSYANQTEETSPSPTIER